jgi:threonine synthase
MNDAHEGTKVVCERCGWESLEGFSTHCPTDGMMLVPKYRRLHEEAQLALSEDSFVERFRQVLPIDEAGSFRETSPLLSPLVSAGDLGRAYGVEKLYLKDETSLPTGTTKARMAAVALAYLAGRGVRRFAVTSTGNSTNAMARLMPFYPELQMTAYAGRDFARRHVIPQASNIRLVVVDGDFVDAERSARAAARAEEVTWEGGFFNPARRVGLATAYLEACWQMGGVPDWYFQAVSSGMGVVAVGEMARCQATGKGRVRRPRLVAVQQESCAPMASAFAEGASRIEDRHRIQNPTGIATAILRGDPSASYPTVRRHILESGGEIVSVSEREIVQAQAEGTERYRIPVGGSAATALAAALKFGREGRIGTNELVLVNLTGRQ